MTSTKKKRVKTIHLDKSDSILFHPDGSIDEEILEDLLSDVDMLKLPKSSYVYTTREKRVSGFNPSDPEWESVRNKSRAGYLFSLYKKINGKNYTPKTLEEADSEMMMRMRRG